MFTATVCLFRVLVMVTLVRSFTPISEEEGLPTTMTISGVWVRQTLSLSTKGRPLSTEEPDYQPVVGKSTEGLGLVSYPLELPPPISVEAGHT